MYINEKLIFILTEREKKYMKEKVKIYDNTSNGSFSLSISLMLLRNEIAFCLCVRKNNLTDLINIFNKHLYSKMVR